VRDPTVLPDDLPVPYDDGAADHLRGASLPSIALPATDGTAVDPVFPPDRGAELALERI
jgi:hypothetical protein